jgi:hypothetical protein
MQMIDTKMLKQLTNTQDKPEMQLEPAMSSSQER